VAGLVAWGGSKVQKSARTVRRKAGLSSQARLLWRKRRSFSKEGPRRRRLGRGAGAPEAGLESLEGCSPCWGAAGPTQLLPSKAKGWAGSKVMWRLVHHQAKMICSWIYEGGERPDGFMTITLSFPKAQVCYNKRRGYLRAQQKNQITHASYTQMVHQF